MFKRATVVIACGLITACGGGNSADDSRTTLPSSFNNPPQIGGMPPAIAQVDQRYVFTPSASDADGDTLTFRIENRPEWATFSPSTGRLEGTPPSTAKPVYERIFISVTDGNAFSELPAFDLTVQGVATTNTAPVISGAPSANVVTGNAYEFIPQVVDPDGQALDFAVTGLPTWAEFDSATGRLWGTPGAGDIGAYAGIVISVSDGVATASLPEFSIDVTSGTPPGPTNRSPVISGSPASSVTVGQAYSFTPSASDPDGQALTFSITNKPSWASFSTSTGRLNGTPAAANAGTYSGIVIAASDGSASASLPSFTLTVSAAAPANRSPVISGSPASSVTVGQAYSFTPSASDPDGQALTFSITNKPSWASFSTSTGRLNGTPAAANAGTYSGIVIAASDGSASASLPSFTLTVSAAAPANRSPVISGSPASSVTVGQAYSFTPSASDPDGQALTFSITNKPSWASFSTSTGRLNGTPAAANAGTYSGIVIAASDGSASASLPSFTLTVSAAAPANRSPVISGSPASSVTVGQAYSFTPSASDPDGQALTFSITNKPSWASFSTSTGRLNGTPAAANAGTYSGIVIAASDGSASASLPSFTLTVSAAAPANRSPVISGSPASSVTVGQAYSFTPSASDPDGQALTFSITNKPSWASFSTSTGRLNGTPAAANAGTYSGIVIAASDGSASASLPSFTLTVQQVQLGSATISWTPPTANTNDTALTNLKGYRIYYGTSSGNLNQVLDLPNAGISNGVVENLSPGTWYFGVKSYNTSNVESALSNITSKTIN